MFWNWPRGGDSIAVSFNTPRNARRFHLLYAHTVLTTVCPYSEISHLHGSTKGLKFALVVVGMKRLGITDCKARTMRAMRPDKSKGEQPTGGLFAPLIRYRTRLYAHSIKRKENQMTWIARKRFKITAANEADFEVIRQQYFTHIPASEWKVSP